MLHSPILDATRALAPRIPSSILPNLNLDLRNWTGGDGSHTADAHEGEAENPHVEPSDVERYGRIENFNVNFEEVLIDQWRIVLFSDECRITPSIIPGTPVFHDQAA